MKCKVRKELEIGLVLYSIFAVFHYLTTTPEFVKGCIVGLALAFLIIDILPQEPYQRLKHFKRSLIKKSDFA